jgi:DNA-binding NtrC family response regulator/serine/threonine protein kinase/tetratricopeptide (TPR) repeat protein
MRYNVRYPLEDGDRITVFDLKDTLFPDKRKVLTLLSASGPEDDYSRWVKHIEARSSIDHPALPRILDVAFRGKNPGLVTDCFEADPLETLAGTIPLKNALQISLVLTDLLHQLHLRKLYIGYINPRKVFIDKDNNPFLNFLVHGDTKSENPVSDYSLRYAAPEYLETGKPSPAADCYSLGMILYILLTGIRPFFETASEELKLKKRLTLPAPLKQINPLLKSSVASLVESLLHPDPKQRLQADELLSGLRKEIPDFTTLPAAFNTGIIGREKEIKEFNQLLRDPEKQDCILVIAGNPGVGKSKLSDYFEIAAKIRGFTVHTIDGGVDNPEESITPPPNGKTLLIRFRNFDSDMSKAFSMLPEAVSSRIIIVIETAGKPDAEKLKSLQNRIPECSVKNLHLNPLNKRKTAALLESILGDNIGFYCYEKISGSNHGNPLYICRFLQSLHASGELFWDCGYWKWAPGNNTRAGIPELIRNRILLQLKTLEPAQLSLLELLVIFDRKMHLNCLAGILKSPEVPIIETARQLEALNLAEVQGGFRNPEIEISQRWISETTRDRISQKEKERIHKKISLVLEESYFREQQLPIACDVCWHSLKSKSTGKAEKYLPSAITYLIKNSSFRKALQLFETSLSGGMISINLPENWLTYIKLLLKTGSEKKCRDFIKGTPGCLLNKKTLFRLGCILDSQDLSVREICPHLSTSMDGIFSQATCLSILRTSGHHNNPYPGTTQAQKMESHWYSHTSIKEKTRCYHQLYRMYCEMGRTERALYYEIKAFRFSLSLGKKEVTARRLLNLVALTLSRDQIKQSSQWLQHCVKMTAETGDIKTRLEAEIYLTVPERKEGRHKKAEFDLARIRALNKTFCGSRKITSRVLLEEAKNLVYRTKFDSALKKIAELNRMPANSGDTLIVAEALLLEVRIWASRSLFTKALSLLDKFKKSPAAGHHSLAARELRLRIRIYLGQGKLESADLYMKELLSRRDFLSAYSQVKTRILQSELNLLQKNIQKAETCVYDALKIADKHFYIPLIAEACFLKAQCLITREEYQLALPYCYRSIRLAAKTNRPELKLKSHLTRKMAENKQNCTLFSPFSDPRDNPVYSYSLNMNNSVGRRQSYQIKTRNFMVFLKTEPRSDIIGRRILSIIKETFPEAHSSLYIKKNESVTRISPDNDTDSSTKTGAHSEKFKRLLQRGSGINKSSSSIIFPIGPENIPFGILSVEFTGETFVSETDYDFIKMLSNLSANPPAEKIEAPAVTRNFSKNNLKLLDGRVIIGPSPRMQEILGTLMNVADMSTTVLLQGESGTGKELLARALHDFSHRKSGPFIAVNCSALPADLVENELFGHLRGSYTGADFTSTGLFEAASGGTIFLDEISTLSLDLQPRLLRVLENKTVRPLGASFEKHLDVRVVSATNQNLEELARTGSFRFDLFSRLNGFNIKIPPLRKRKTDIQRICVDYIQKHPCKSDKALSEQALEELGKYDYPGNVRELLNIMENLLCFSSSRVISGEDVKKHLPASYQNSEILENETVSGGILEEVSRGNLNFWEGVKKPFISRDINRAEVRIIISEGLKKCDGSYKDLLDFFNLQPGEYKKFLSFLEHHDCKVDFRKFRGSNNHRN